MRIETLDKKGFFKIELGQTLHLFFFNLILLFSTIKF